MTINLHVYPSNFTHETRILKETKSLTDHGIFDKIVICALWDEGLAEHEPLDGVREVWRIKPTVPPLIKGLFAKTIRMTGWLVLIFLRFRRAPVVCVNCHSWAMLPLGIVFKIWRRAKLVYDAHELETETSASRAQRLVARVVERACMRHVDALIVVSESIAEWYRRSYGPTNIRVVRNIPYRRTQPLRPSSVLKDELGISSDSLLFIYQGALERGRNVEMLLRVFAQAPGDRHIVFLGFGELADMVKRHTSEYANIHFYQSVPPSQVLTYTASADIGLDIIENVCLNHYYCLPNKVFEYLLAGLPQIVSDFPEMSKVITEDDCGWTTAVAENDVLNLIKRLTRAEVLKKKANALRARDRYAWEDEEIRLMAVYKDLFPNPDVCPGYAG
jgi:glycosyltransferase involved in cell wall biosynthesis